MVAHLEYCLRCLLLPIPLILTNNFGSVVSNSHGELVLGMFQRRCLVLNVHLVESKVPLQTGQQYGMRQWLCCLDAEFRHSRVLDFDPVEKLKWKLDCFCPMAGEKSITQIVLTDKSVCPLLFPALPHSLLSWSILSFISGISISRVDLAASCFACFLLLPNPVP